MLYDLMGTYDIAFICSGVPPILASCILFLIRSESRRDDEEEKDTDEAGNEKERSLMITPGMEDKEAEANAMNSEYVDGKKKKTKKKGKKNGDNGEGQDGVAHNVRRGRRRSYMRYRMPLLDTRIKMVTEKTPDVIDHRPNGVISNGGVHHHAGGDNRHKGGDLADGFSDDGSRSPYSQRNRNQSNHKDAKSNGAISNGHLKVEVNGSLHRSFSQDSEVALKLNTMEQETTV